LKIYNTFNPESADGNGCSFQIEFSKKHILEFDITRYVDDAGSDYLTLLNEEGMVYLDRSNYRRIPISILHLQGKTLTIYGGQENDRNLIVQYDIDVENNILDLVKDILSAGVPEGTVVKIDDAP
jgi:hypothetical protein